MAAGFMPSRLVAFLLISCVLRRGRAISAIPPALQNITCGTQKNQIGSDYDDHVRWLLANLTESVIKDGAISDWAHVGNGASDPDGGGVGCVAMCYADHSREDCARCLRYAAGRNDCPNLKNASAVYDACQVWYYQFPPVLGPAYVSVVFRSYLGLDLTDRPEVVSFRNKRRWLLQDLSSRAIASKQYAAAGRTEYGYDNNNGSIYGLVQCERFLSGHKCSSCLSGFIGRVDVDTTMVNKTIGAIKGYYCYIRYGTQQFDDYVNEYMASSSSSPSSAWAMAPVPTAQLVAPLPPPHKGGCSVCLPGKAYNLAARRQCSFQPASSGTRLTTSVTL